MKKEERPKYKYHFLFTFDEMMNQKLERWESYILKNDISSIVLSLIVDMFKYVGDTRNGEEILDECFSDEKWYEAHTWTKEQHNEWETSHIVPILRKRWKVSKDRAERETGWFMLQYSFKIKE